MMMDRETIGVALVSLSLTVLASFPTLGADPKPLRTLIGGPGPVSDLLFSPDGTKVAAKTFTEDFFVWDLATGKRSEFGRGRLAPLMFSRDGKSLILHDFASQRQASALDIASGKFTNLTMKDYAEYEAISPDGKWLLLRKNGGSLWVGRLETPYNVGTVRDPVFLDGAVYVRKSAHLNPFSEDSRSLILGPAAKILEWDAETRKQRTFESEDRKWFVVSPDGRTLLAEQRPKSIPGYFSTPKATYPILDLATGSKIATLKTERNQVDPRARFSPDGSTIATISVYQISLFDAKDGSALREFDRQADETPRELLFSPDGRLLAARTGGRKQAFLFWEVKTGWLAGEVPAEADLMAFSSDSSTFATATKDGDVRLWDIREIKGKPRPEPGGPPRRANPNRPRRKMGGE